METIGTGIRKEHTTIPCCIPEMSVKHWFFVITLVLLFMALCTVVFAGEPGQQTGYCDLQRGLPATSDMEGEGMRVIENIHHFDYCNIHERDIY